jgi:hypothetical protein
MRTVHQSTYQNYIAKSTYLGNTINGIIFHDYCNKGDLDNMDSLDEEENGKNANTITISKSFHDLSHLISQDMPV